MAKNSKTQPPPQKPLEGLHITPKGLMHGPGSGEPYPQTFIQAVGVAREWIQERVIHRGMLTKRVQDWRSSYGFKHDAEKWASTYIPNGAFILAALEEGLLIQPDGGLNAYFNISKKVNDPPPFNRLIPRGAKHDVKGFESYIKSNSHPVGWREFGPRRALTLDHPDLMWVKHESRYQSDDGLYLVPLNAPLGDGKVLRKVHGKNLRQTAEAYWDVSSVSNWKGVQTWCMLIKIDAPAFDLVELLGWGKTRPPKCTWGDLLLGT